MFVGKSEKSSCVIRPQRTDAKVNSLDLCEERRKIHIITSADVDDEHEGEFIIAREMKK